MYQLHSSFLWLQYRSAPKCGDLILLLPKDLNPALKRYAEGTSPGTGRLSYKLIQGCPGQSSPVPFVWETISPFTDVGEDKAFLIEGFPIFLIVRCDGAGKWCQQKWRGKTLKLMYEELRKWNIADKWVTLAWTALEKLMCFHLTDNVCLTLVGANKNLQTLPVVTSFLAGTTSCKTDAGYYNKI